MNPILVVCLLLLAFMAGAAVFSFLEVVVYRLPRKMNYVSGHSVCAACGKKLTAPQLVPVFSFAFLGGRCGFCKAKIPVSCLFAEFFGGALSVFTLWFFAGDMTGTGVLRALLMFAFLSALYTVGRIDAETMEIPNGLVLLCAALSIGAYFLFPEITLVERLIGLVVVSVPFLLLTLVIPGAFGGGDMKLMAACGLFLGWKLCLLSLFFALLFGGASGAYLMLTKKKSGRDHFAFGPFLCAGMALAVFFGQPVLEWYGSFFRF